MQHRLPSILACLAVVAVAAPARPAVAQQAATETPALQQQLNEWFRRAARAAPGEWGVAVANQNGQLLWAVNPTKPLIPASTVKIFTTGFARTTLGANARQVTRVLGTGYVDPNGTWAGTWALEVNGDPTLERPTRSGPMLHDLATQLADRGVKRLAGPLSIQSAQGEATTRFPDSWSPKHRGRRFAPLIGAVTLNENLISFTIAPGRVGTPPRVVASAPDGVAELVEIKAKTVTGRRDRLRILPQPGGRYLVTGTIGVGRRGRTYGGPTSNPRAVLEAAWAAALRGAGIDWSRGPALSGADGRVTGRQTLAEVVSAPFDSIAHEINTRSLNIGAEALLEWAAGPTADAARRLTEHVRQITGDNLGVTLVDGSGLSSLDRASPLTFVTYLARMPTTPGGRNFALLLPAAGSGTLRKLGSGVPAPGVVHAKTGTLGNSSTLVGYLGHKDGMLLISVMYNGPRVYAAKSQQWKLFRTLGAQGTIIPSDSVEAELGGEGVPPN